MADKDDIVGEVTARRQSELQATRPRIVILGGGFAGLTAAKRLAGVEADVVVVDKRNHHLFQPLLYQVATAGLSPGDIASPIRSVLGKQDNAQVLLAEAVEVDREERRVELATGELNYDYLVVAVGAQPKFFGPDEWQQHATPLKSMEDALELREEILYAFERAEQSDDPEEVEKWLTFVIVGGGATGVEMAGAIREIAAEVMVRDFRSIRPENTRVVLIDALPHILSSYPESLSEQAQESLEEKGVEVRVESPVEEISDDHVGIEGEEIPTRTVVWAAGVEPVPLVESLDSPLSDDGRVIVDRDLTLPNDDRVFVLGDAAYAEDEDGSPLPGLAPVALQQGKQTAANLKRAIAGDPMEPFDYWDRGQMATIGRNSAVAVSYGYHLTGFLAWLAWLFVHLLFLIGFRNKIGVLIDWVYSYLTFKRSARLILGEPEPPELRAERLLESEDGDESD